MTRTISTPAGLDALPVGSIIADFGPDRSWNDSAVIACKAAAGDWATMGSHPRRRWQSSAIFDASLGHVVAVLHDPSDPSVPAPDPDDRGTLTNVLLDLLKKSINQCSCGEPQPLGTWHQSHQADAILGLGFRRLTVTPQMVEAGAKVMWELDPTTAGVPAPTTRAEWEEETSGYLDDARVVLVAALGDTK